MAKNDDSFGFAFDTASDPATMISEFSKVQGDAMRAFWETWVPGAATAMPDRADGDSPDWIRAMGEMQTNWMAAMEGASPDNAGAMDTMNAWMQTMSAWQDSIAPMDKDALASFWQESVALWETISAQYAGRSADGAQAGEIDLPRSDRRFSDPAWRENPAFALIHQTYLLLAEKTAQSVDAMDHLDDEQRERLKFFSRAALDAASPANLAATNPMVLKKTIESGGQNLVRGMQHLMADMESGQLSHVNKQAFKLGENIATTPGKVVHETPLYQLIQYAPSTADVLETPLVIFPPWINRFYILDLNEKKSFIKWCVDHSITTFIVSWKSADESMADLTWDDYVRAQIEAMDVVRDRLGVKDVHTIGYCVAGTTLAATLAVLNRRKEADRVKSATFFTAQVDFELAGDLKNFVDDNQLQLLETLGQNGYTDGRYLAATFNLLRGNDLIWNYVVSNYLMGEDYPAFDLLFWNGDVTNLPAAWHRQYLRDLYRDNLMTKPDALEVDGTPIDLSDIKTPIYVQAGREDHIAPVQSVWKIMDHVSGPARFMLAGSGHIAGVVNPPDAGKYQHWTNEGEYDSLDSFLDGATENPGSWWTDWLDWLREHNPKMVKAKGKRRLDGKASETMEDAPGRYVMMR